MRPFPLVVVAPLLFAGCPGPSADDEVVDTDAVGLTWPHLTCDPIVDYCGFPFPSNTMTVPDASTPTGLRVALEAGTMPRPVFGDGTDPAVFNLADGFSPGTPILAHFPGAVGDGLVGPGDDLALSLEDDSLTILINTTTRERVPHWAELDALATKGGDDRTLILHPAVRLDDATRYVVGIRGLVDGSGAPIQATAAFQDLIDGNDAERAALYDDVFEWLTDNEWTRDETLLAWDFTTRSKQDLTQWLVSMRDQGVALYDAEGMTYTIDSVEDDWNPDTIGYRIHGHFPAPLFLSQVEPGGTLLLGDDGLPVRNTSTPTMDVPFELLIPRSVVDGGGVVPLLMYGHGLFGDKSEIESGAYRTLIHEHGYAIGGIDLIGMAEDDGAWLENPATTPLLGGRMDEVVRFHDRLHQGFLNHVLFLHMLKTQFAEDPTYGAWIDGDEAFYYGVSQGGIMGVVHAGLSRDFTKATLEVMGQPYSLLLPRSVDFTPFFDVLKLALQDGRDLYLGLALAQQTWSRVEADGWSAYVTGNRVDFDTPAKTLLLRDAVGDHQVTTLGAHILARTVGARHVDTGVREVFGLRSEVSVENETALAEWDFGLPVIPPCNVPMSLCDDPHDKVRGRTEAQRQLATFFSVGRIRNECQPGACSFPEASGCDGETDADSLALCP
ncbi:MAG: hypothetical protein H6733_10840 [Alphaproteobacteria bacterium]|nr:hypothetical protein [Alphaproteobacteria bacterium]